LLEEVFREHWGRVLASLIGFLGDFDRAEEAAAEAFAAAAQRWPRDGTPANPVGWLITTGRHRAIDRVRRERTEAIKTRQLEVAEGVEDDVLSEMDGGIGDERLELLFCCCHPALGTEAQVALTLRALGGLQTEEIARTFLVSPQTMKRRLSRAKAKIRLAGIPFAVPAAELLPERLATVLAVIYLIFNEGYSSSASRADLAREAVRLGHALAELMPDESEVHGLLGLMLLHDARRQSRFVDGELVLLADQDRALWDAARLAAGRARVDRAFALRGRGTYALQAAIAALHTADPIDWPEVVALYRELEALTGSPVVRLNLAVAVAESGDPEAGLAVADALAGELDGYRYLHSTRAELLRRLGHGPQAARAYERALELTDDGAERRFLARRLAEV
jgi:RNA polymerase sigma-70 factor (ECF subfamily)